MAAGAIRRTFPIPGLDEKCIGIRTIEEAIALRNQVLERIEFASTALDPAERQAALTFVVVGGGIGGIETLTELEDLARATVATTDHVKQEEMRFVLVEAMGRIMPEIAAEQAEWVVGHLRGRGIEILRNTSLASIEGSTLKLINLPDKTPAREFAADTLIWTAGTQANPVVRSTDLPLEPRGRVRVLPDLRVAGDDGITENAWAAGDIAAVPDLTGKGLPDGTCVPNAQHALRQAKLLARNLWASRRDRPLRDYKHKNLGVVAGFGPWKGVANINLVGHIHLTGPIAWLAHRGYHSFTIHAMARKFHIGVDWVPLVPTRDTTVREPR
jgi:NADH dehydrogenase